MENTLFIPLGFGGYCLRNWQKSDKDRLVLHANNRKIWLNVRNHFPYPYQEDHAESWIDKILKNPDDSLHLVIDSKEGLAGAIGLERDADVFCKTANLGYWLGEPYWGKGVATAAVKSIVEYAFDHFDFIRISAEVFSWNPASRRVLEKAGFQQEAHLKKAVYKNGEILDLLIYALVR